MPAGSAVATGMRISLHNDPPVTPEEPLRNISVAATRVAPSGRVLAPEERLTVDQAIRAQTIDAAWQLFSDDVVGSLRGRQVRGPGGAVGRPARGAPGGDRRSGGARDIPGGTTGVCQIRLRADGTWHAHRMTELPEPTFLADRVAHWAAVTPDNEAVTYLDRTWTWAQWYDRIRRLAGALSAWGVRRGDVVAFLDKNHPAGVELTFAASLLGAANSVINFRLAADELDYVINDCGATVLVVGAELRPAIDAIVAKLTAVEHIVTLTPDGADGDEYEALLAGAQPMDRDPEVRPDDVCVIMYSSGTTGKPKGVALTQANLIAHTVNAFHGYGFDDGDKNLVAMPLFHVGGTSYAQLGIHYGVPSYDPRGGRRRAGRWHPGRGQPHVPGARGAGQGARFRPGRGEAVRGAQDLLLRRFTDAACRCCVLRWRPGRLPISSRCTGSPSCAA